MLAKQSINVLNLVAGGVGEECQKSLGGKGTKKQRTKETKEGSGKDQEAERAVVNLFLHFKRYIFDSGKKMTQTYTVSFTLVVRYPCKSCAMAVACFTLLVRSGQRRPDEA